jgi:hypothetical protein
VVVIPGDGRDGLAAAYAAEGCGFEEARVASRA